MADRPDILSAKVERLARIIEDAEPQKGNKPADVRKAQADAAREVIEAGGSVAAVESVALPSDRLNGGKQ